MLRWVKKGFVALLVMTLMLSCFVPATLAEKKHNDKNVAVEQQVSGEKTQVVEKVTKSKTKKAKKAADVEQTDPAKETEKVERVDAAKKTVKPKKISISGSDTVKKGKTTKLSAKVSPAGAPQGVTWKTSDKKIATVSSKGVVTGVKAGKATITATSTANKKVKAAFTITVPGSKATKVTVTAPSTELSLTQKTMQLTAKATPADAAQEFTWKSSKPKVATVDENGMVTAVAAGTAKITATAKDGSKKKGTITIKVVKGNEDMTLTVMLPDFYSDSDWKTLEDGNPILKEIYDDTGVKLNVIWVPNSGYGEQTTLTLAELKNLPDIMVMQGPQDNITISSARAGVFWDLTDLIAQYPNLADGQQTIYDNISIDGKVYGIYRSRAYARAGIYYRKDYAAKVGYTEEPKTVEEFKDMCMKLAALDSDTYVINMCSYATGTIGIMTVMNGAPYQYGVDKDGKLYPAFEDEAFQDGLDFLRDLYAAGGIDPNFMTISSGNWNDAERNEQALARLDCLDNGYRLEEWLEQNTGVDPEKPVVSLLTALPDKNGNIQIWPQNIGASGEVVVTKAVSQEKLPAVMKFLDWCNSEKGQTLLNCGVEGQTYWIHKDGNRYTYPEGEEEKSAEYAAKTNTIQHSLNQLGMNVNGDLTPATATTPLRSEYNQNLKDNAKYVIANPCLTLESETNNLVGATINNEVENAQVQYIAGQIDLTGLKGVYKDWYAKGGEKILAEYQAKYDTLK